MYQRFGEALQKKSTDHPVDPSSDPSKKDINMSDAPPNAQQQVNPSGQAVPATSDPSAPAIQTSQLAASNHNVAQSPAVPQQQQPQSQTQLQPASIMPQTHHQVTNPLPVSSNHVSDPSGHVPTSQPVAASAVAPTTPAVTPSASASALAQPVTTPTAQNATPTAATITPVQVSAPPVISPSPAISPDVAGQLPVSQIHPEAPLANPANANSVTNVSTGNPTPQQPQSQATVAPTQPAPPQ